MKNAAFGVLVVGALCGGAIGCSGESDSPALGEDSEALTQSACAGSACAALALPKPLNRGRIANVGNVLYWVAAGTALDSNGAAVDELQHCTLPACASVGKLPLIGANGISLRARDVRAANGRVLFVATKPGSGGKASFYLSNGQTFTEVYSGHDDEHDAFAVDDRGVAIYSKDRRTDGWARSSLRHCEFINGGAGLEPARACASFKDKSLNAVQGVALSPTRTVVVRGGTVTSFERSTLTGSRDEHVWAAGGASQLTTIGEMVLSVRTTVRSHGGGARHETSFSRESSPAIGVTIDGVLGAKTSAGKNLYAATVGEGDVWGVPKIGVVARISSAGKRVVLATDQDGLGVAVSGSKVYWLDNQSPAADEDPSGVVRSHAK